MSWLRRSLSVRIALLVLGLMFVVAGGLSWMSYRAVRGQTAAAFRERLASLASQFVESGSAGPRETMARLTRLAADPAVASALTPGASEATRARALEILRAGSPSIVAAPHLVDSSGRRRLSRSSDTSSWFGPAAEPRRPCAASVPTVASTTHRVFRARVPVLRDSGRSCAGPAPRTVLSSRTADAVASPGRFDSYVIRSVSRRLDQPHRFIHAPPEPPARRHVSRLLERDRLHRDASRLVGTPFCHSARARGRSMAPANDYLRRAACLAWCPGAGRRGAFLSAADRTSHRAMGMPPAPRRRRSVAAAELARGSRTARPGLQPDVDQSPNHETSDRERGAVSAPRRDARDIVSLRGGDGHTLYLSHPARCSWLFAGSWSRLRWSSSPSRRPRTGEARPDGDGARGGPGVATAPYRVRRGDGQ